MQSARWLSLAVLAALAACGSGAQSELTGPNPALPWPEKSLLPVVNIAPAVGWAQDAAPVPAHGLRVQAFARDLDHPRWVLTLPSGDVLVAESNAPKRPEADGSLMGFAANLIMKRAGAVTTSADRITLLRDGDGDGVAEQRHVLLKDLHSPFGMALVGDQLFVANTDAVARFPYQPGVTEITAAGVKVADLPAGPRNWHWTKNLIASPDGQSLYVAVGSNSNIAENGLDVEQQRAAILQINPATGATRVYASGLRNPVGMAWEPVTGALWTVVNERDELGNNLVPDYMTSVRDGGFYGWPWSYFGQNVDERVQPQQPELVAKALVPDYALGAHTASLGLATAQGNSLGVAYTSGMFIGQHGSWNRKPHSGYKVIFVPFVDGKPNGAPWDVLSGFLSAEGKAQGRPVGVALDKTGALLVADDVGNVIWRVSAAH